jgi:4-hydroxy-tetrahydrodipicolinate reductase
LDYNYIGYYCNNLFYKIMKKINLSITGCMGRMGQQLIRSSKNNKNFKLVSLTENKIINKKISGIKPGLNNIDSFKNTNVIIDFTIPKCTLEILRIASKLKKKVIIGTTGFSKRDENLIKKFSKKIPILKAGNMSIGVNLLMYLTEIASKSLGDNFLSKIYEVHHKHKIDYPSGTALMLGKGIADGKNKNLYNLIGKKYLNKKSFPYSKKINFNSIRKGKIIGEHEVRFSSGKEIVKLHHESFDRALYSEGALTAAAWLVNKKPGLYSMRDLLNFK